ncbi:MAG: permease-like cell division protein FtsX [Gammaproteobacteria bacterium]
MLMNYFTRHMQASIYNLGKFSRSPIANIIICIVIGIALALPAVLFVALKNAEIISGSFQQSTQLTLYLKKNVTDKQALDLTSQLQTRAGVQNARAISPEDGLIELQKQAGFDGTLENLHDNPLPWVIIVTPNESERLPAKLEQFQQQLKLLPPVENVQLDMLWVKRLATLVNIAHRIAYALALFLGIAVLIIVNNTIRAATEQHDKEIEIIKLIGGTHAFIRRPFLYAGMTYGLIGGIFAWILIEILLLFLNTPVKHLADLYDSQLHLAGLGLANALILLLSGVLLGLAGSWFAVTKHLRQPRA